MERCVICGQRATTTAWQDSVALPACAEHEHEVSCLADDLSEERAAMVRTWRLRATPRPQLAR